MSAGKTEASIYQQAEDGKTELSLMHFAITNPKWQPPRESTAFIGFLKERVHRDSSVALAQQAVLPENALFSSIQSLQSESEVPGNGGGRGVFLGCQQAVIIRASGQSLPLSVLGCETWWISTRWDCFWLSRGGPPGLCAGQ